MNDRMSSTERITYLVANHDLGHYVGDCLTSLMAQTDPNWLAIVVDDASSDDSLNVIRSFDDRRIRVLSNESNIGYIGTLRRLIDEAETDILAVLDADDTLAPDATERLRATYEADPGAEFVFSRFATYDEELANRRGVHGSAVPDGSSTLREGLVGHIRSFRRSAYRRTAGLDDTMLYAEDRDLVYKLEEVSRPVFIDAVLYNYREVPGSQSRDPEKREIGASNTRRARRAAVRRRNISGTQRLLHEALFWADYLAYSERPPATIRSVARRLAGVAVHLCRAVPIARAIPPNGAVVGGSPHVDTR